MKAIAEIISLSSEFLHAKGIDNAKRAAEELIADALGLSRLELYMSFDRPLENTEIDLIRSRLSRRAKGEPWQYIAQYVDFYNLKLKVTPAALIPRQETEILVEMIAKELSAQQLSGLTLLDLCAGSGCIGLALKKRFPELQVILADISEDALQLASENAKENCLSVELLKGDFLHAALNRIFDFIVCNPPYISEKDYESLHVSVKNFEPKLALEAKENGLEFYLRFEQEGSKYLKKKAWFEIGYDQGEQLKRIFNTPPWKNQIIKKDWSLHDRFFSLEIE